MRKSATGKIRKHVPCRKNSKLKGPGIRKSLACLRNRKEPSATETERMVWEEVRDTTRVWATQSLGGLIGLDFSPSVLGS